MDVLVLDIGGSHVKAHATSSAETRRFESGRHLTPDLLVDRVHDVTDGWEYDVISIGYPGSVGANGPADEPGNLGKGWVGFDFAAVFGVPVRVVNDAVLQALGGYEGGRMLFLGLGTGLGSALITEHVVVPMELGNILHATGQPLGDVLGHKGQEALGPDRWKAAVYESVSMFGRAFAADYTLLGGGNAGLIDPLPPGTRLGGNEDAFAGGVKLWEEFVEPHDRPPALVWRVVN